MFLDCQLCARMWLIIAQSGNSSQYNVVWLHSDRPAWDMKKYYSHLVVTCHFNKDNYVLELFPVAVFQYK